MFCDTHSFFVVINFSRDQKVRILRQKHDGDDDGDAEEEEFTIVGVDEFGYLRVEDVRGRSKVLQPNGNSIDMLAGLVIKQNQP